MTTFSQLVDKMVLETRRPDMRAEVISYLNQTIREVHFHPVNNASVLYRENIIEQQLTATSEVGLGFDLPDPTSFQALGVVRYDSIVCRDDLSRYPPEKTPGRGMAGVERFYYRAGSRFFFKGYGGVNSIVSMAYYEYPRRLKYYLATARPAEYDSDMGWTYSEPFSGTPELNLAAQRFTTNWILLRWDMVLEEGLRAKIYKRLSDTDRARTAFSLYTQLRMGLVTSESLTPGGFR